MEVTATNGRGATAVDVLQELPCPEEGDLLPGNVLSAADVRATSRGNPVQPGNGHGGSNYSPTAPATGMNPDEWFRYTNTTWEVVSLLMATLAYQAILQPPGGFKNTGKAALAGSKAFTMFMAFNMVVFFASTSIILLPLCAPRHKRTKLMTTVLLWLMRSAVLCSLLTFSSAALAIAPDGRRAPCFILSAWMALILGISVVWLPANCFETSCLRCFPRTAALARSRDNLSLRTNAGGKSTVDQTMSHSIEVGSAASSTQTAAVLYAQSQSNYVPGGMHIAS